jgi:hypothetical protein
MFIGITQELQASKKHWMDERGCREIQSKVIIEPREAKNSSAGKKITKKNNLAIGLAGGLLFCTVKVTYVLL